METCAPSLPRGHAEDPTRPPQFYDVTFNYLKEIGLETLE